MSLNKSALFFLASVAMEETKTIYKGKFINDNFLKKTKRNK